MPARNPTLECVTGGKQQSILGGQPQGGLQPGQTPESDSQWSRELGSAPAISQPSTKSLVLGLGGTLQSGLSTILAEVIRNDLPTVGGDHSPKYCLIDVIRDEPHRDIAEQGVETILE